MVCPCLKPTKKIAGVIVASHGREEALTLFYDRFMANDFRHFRIPLESSSGLGPFLERARLDHSFGPDFLKAQIIGPASFGLSVKTDQDKIILDDPDLADTVVKGLGAKGAWLAGRIREMGRTPIIFFDEPGLTGYGSAFTPLGRDQVVAMINEVVEIARSQGDILTGVHICGNTDWSMITSTNLDIINFDAFGHLDHFLLYPKDIKAFLARGGYLAWGLIPTLDFDDDETAEHLAGLLKSGWEALADKGLDLDLIRERSLITPACGVGPVSPAKGPAHPESFAPGGGASIAGAAAYGGSPLKSVLTMPRRERRPGVIRSIKQHRFRYSLRQVSSRASDHPADQPFEISRFRKRQTNRMIPGPDSFCR